jgi:hypothetical protein
MTTMDRRSFLRSLVGLVVAPRIAYVLPPPGGWQREIAAAFQVPTHMIFGGSRGGGKTLAWRRLYFLARRLEPRTSCPRRNDGGPMSTPEPTTALMRYQDRWSCDDPVRDYVEFRHDALVLAAMGGGPEAVRLYEEVVVGPERPSA